MSSINDVVIAVALAEEIIKRTQPYELPTHSLQRATTDDRERTLREV
jgi:hypothetical protein